MRTVTCILILLLSPTLYAADSVVFTGTSICKDAMMKSQYPDNNYSTDTFLTTYSFFGMIPYWALMGGVDSTALADSITPGTTIDSCALLIWVFSASASVINWYGVLSNWDEGTCTWNSCSTGNTWGKSGCDSAGSAWSNCGLGGVDRTVDTIGSHTFVTEDHETWVTIDLDTNWVNGWFNGSARADGLTSHTNDQFQIKWNSSESGNPPKWIFWYTPEAPPPIESNTSDTMRYGPGEETVRY